MRREPRDIAADRWGFGRGRRLRAVLGSLELVTSKQTPPTHKTYAV